MRCIGCNAPIALAPGERIAFRDECDQCGADLHTCTHCAHYSPGAYNDCREPSAERVGDAERANRCDWFQAGEGEAAADDRRSAAQRDLEALFKKSD